MSLGPLQISPTGVSPSALCFSKTVRLSVWVLHCDPQPRSASTPVWPLPRSLAATWRIDVSFSSWGYLDVSVHPVSFCMLCVHMQMHTHCSMRVPPFGNLRFIRYLLLTAAYRSLSRPSSASGAKASALCSFLLDQLPDVASSGLSFTIVTQCEMFSGFLGRIRSITLAFSCLVSLKPV